MKNLDAYLKLLKRLKKHHSIDSIIEIAARLLVKKDVKFRSEKQAVIFQRYVIDDQADEIDKNSKDSSR